MMSRLRNIGRKHFKHMEPSGRSFEFEKSKEREAVKEKLMDLTYLPSREEIFKVFDPDALTRDDDLKDEWWHFVNDPDHRMYEILNKEYLNDFGNYLASRIKELGGTKEKPLEILELGAGDGRLAHFLKIELDKRVTEEYKYITTDSQTWVTDRPLTGRDIDEDKRTYAVTPTFPIDYKLDADEAMKKFNPDIVIVSWMPSKVDFTEAIRKNKSVKEYLLIGWPYDDVCGDMGKTWGVWARYKEDEAEPTEFEKDGFEDIPLEEVSKNQIGKGFDDFYTRMCHPSETVSFRKKK